MTERAIKKTTKEFLKFGDVKIEEKKFHCSKKVIDVRDVDIEKIVVSHKLAYGRNKETDAKYFIGYKIGEKLYHYSFELPKMTGLLNKFEKFNTCPL